MKKIIEDCSYEIIDNLLPLNEFKELQHDLMHFEFPWYCQQYTVTQDNENEMCYFTHTVVEKSICHSPKIYDKLITIFQSLEVKSIIRVKCNLFPKQKEIIFSPKHVDYEFPHKSALFYINTNNGPTVLEDGTKIDSIENRLLKFNTQKIHQASYCSDAKTRINIIFNYF